MSRATSTSLRWCPTPEQLTIIQQMYKSGSVISPNATQIQQITTHLSYYGRIEAKNVFYWFQNHKARERQKIRRKVSMQLHHKTQPKCFQEEQNITKNFHHLFYYIDDKDTNFNYKSLVSCSTPPQQMFSCCSTASSLLQGGCNEDAASTTKMRTCVKKATTMEICCGEDWNMVKLDEGDENRQLKTLELFPIKDTTTNLKEDCCEKTTQISDDDENINMSLSLSLSLYI